MHRSPSATVAASHTPPVGRRLHAALATRSGRRAIAAVNVVVLVAALAPFALWEGFGPPRFDEVELGRHPDLLEVEAGAPLATPGDTADHEPWQAASLPYDLSPTTTVTLVFSVGSKGVDPDEAAELRVHDVGDRGADGLTDTMMLVVADRATGRVALLSVPRDLWVFARGHRINATFNRHGAQALVDDVSSLSGLPIHHLVQVNFAAFARLVDALGGVAMSVDRPLADVPAVLYVPEPGCWRFDGASALAWARSRHTRTQQARGDWVADRSASDFGRIERQQALLGATWDQVRSPGAITSLPELLGVARDGLVVDDGLGVQQVRDLMAAFGDVAAGHVEGHTLPTTGRRIGQAAAQVVEPRAASEVLTRLRTWPPRDTDHAPPSARPLPDRTLGGPLLAAPDTLALPTDTECTVDVARPLPDPREPLWGVAAQTGAGTSDETPVGESAPPASDDTQEEAPRDAPGPDHGTDAPPAADDDATGPADEPSPEPEDPDGPDPEPSPSPSPSESSWIPVPLPG